MNRGARKQRGVALITAVLIVALATIIAVNVGYRAYLDQRRASTAYAMDQGFQIAMGAEAWAADILREDSAKSAAKDDFTEAWATPIPPLPIDGGEVAGQLEDMQGRFNLNSLVTLDATGTRKVNPEAVRRFEHLLELLDLEQKWANFIVDWVDDDQNGSSPGAEDNEYTTLNPPYRAPNMPITRATELLALQEFGVERFRKLEPFVTALPADTKLNVCTAPPVVLDAYLPSGQQQFAGSTALTQSRKTECFPSKKVMADNFTDAREKNLFERDADEKSNYFQATVWVTIGTTEFTLYSLMRRDGGATRPILRSFGTR